MSIPNLITIGRILLVPAVVWSILAQHFGLAFALFVIAGISDAIDGFLAKRCGMATELGAYLDPLADKALLVSIYVALAADGYIPLWFTLLVVSRDIMIVGAILLSWLVDKPVTIRPLRVSKLNTAAQIVFAASVIGTLGFGITPGPIVAGIMYVTAALTALSAAAYLAEWTRHMAN